MRPRWLNRRSIVVRVLVLQFLVVQLFSWVFYFYAIRNAMAIGTGQFDQQQAVVTRGMLAQLAPLIAQPELMRQAASNYEMTYREAVLYGRARDEQSTAHSAKQDFTPLFEVIGQDGTVLYRSANIPPFPAHTGSGEFSEQQYMAGTWRFHRSVDARHGIVVIHAESVDQRRWMVLPTPRGLLIDLTLQLVVLLVCSFMLARFGLKPLRVTAREIAKRSRIDLSPVSVGLDYAEMRPLIVALNDLMERIGTMRRHEKDFLADAAHELRTPIAAMRTQLHVLLNARDEAERAEVAHEIDAGLDRAASLAHQLITLARIESESYMICPEAVNLAEMAQDRVAHHAPVAMQRRIEIAYSGPEEQWVRGDLPALTSILDNLLSNAIKYGTEGGQVEVSVEPRMLGVRLWVRDDGPGVPPEAKARLFERFYRVPGLEVSGSGLGLAIVNSLVMRHGGSIQITAGLGERGIGFAVDLPA